MWTRHFPRYETTASDLRNEIFLWSSESRYQFSSEMSRFLFADVGLETINCESRRDESERFSSAARQHLFTFLRTVSRSLSKLEKARYEIMWKINPNPCKPQSKCAQDYYWSLIIIFYKPYRNFKWCPKLNSNRNPVHVALRAL